MKPTNKCEVQVVVDKTQGGAYMLDFLALSHRHFQKELPEAITGGPESGIYVYRLPVDMLGMVVKPHPHLTDQIEEVLVAYVKKG